MPRQDKRASLSESTDQSPPKKKLKKGAEKARRRSYGSSVSTRVAKKQTQSEASEEARRAEAAVAAGVEKQEIKKLHRQQAEVDNRKHRIKALFEDMLPYAGFNSSQSYFCAIHLFPETGEVPAVECFVKVSRYRATRATEVPPRFTCIEPDWELAIDGYGVGTLTVMGMKVLVPTGTADPKSLPVNSLAEPFCIAAFEYDGSRRKPVDSDLDTFKPLLDGLMESNVCTGYWDEVTLTRAKEVQEDVLGGSDAVGFVFRSPFAGAPTRFQSRKCQLFGSTRRNGDVTCDKCQRAKNYLTEQWSKRQKMKAHPSTPYSFRSKDTHHDIVQTQLEERLRRKAKLEEALAENLFEPPLEVKDSDELNTGLLSLAKSIFESSVSPTLQEELNTLFTPPDTVEGPARQKQEHRAQVIRSIFEGECSAALDRDPSEFAKDQAKAKDSATHSNGMRWSPVSIRVFIAIMVRSPDTLKVLDELGILKTPALRTLKRRWTSHKLGSGINVEYFLDARESFLRYIESEEVRKDHGELKIEDEWFSLHFDEVKLVNGVGWNAANARFHGLADTTEGGKNRYLYDLFEEPNPDKLQEEADHALVFLMRSLRGGSKWKFIVAHTLVKGSWSADKIHPQIIACLSYAYFASFKIHMLISDGASFNITAYKRLLGLPASEIGLNDMGNLAFPHPCDERIMVHTILCTVHGAKRFVANFWNSQPGKTRNFLVPFYVVAKHAQRVSPDLLGEVTPELDPASENYVEEAAEAFKKDHENTHCNVSWLVIRKLWAREVVRSEGGGLTRKCPKLKYEDVHRNAFTALRVPPAIHIMDDAVVRELIAYARKTCDPGTDERRVTVATLLYIWSMNLMYTKGYMDSSYRGRLLSFDSQGWKNIMAAEEFFLDWGHALPGLNPTEKKSEYNLRYLAWQHLDNMRWVTNSTKAFLLDYWENFEGCAVWPKVWRNCSLESIFSRMKALAKGSLSGANVAATAHGLNCINVGGIADPTCLDQEIVM